MKNRKGITLIALVVTIIILLILAAVTISLTLGTDGIVERARETKVAGRYGNIMDKIAVRDTELEVAFARNQEGEHQEDFINRMIAEGAITSDDDYDDVTYRTIYLGKQSDGSYKHTISVADGTVEGKKIAEAIKSLPDADTPGNEHLKNMTLIIKTTAANQTVTLPISNATGLTINWNAINNPTNFENPNPAINPTKTYASIGEYEVQINGESGEGSVFGGNAGYSNPYIVGIKYWGENRFKAINSFGRKLSGIIPVPSKNSFKNVTSFASTFIMCGGLTGSIPEALFANCPDVTNFADTFSYCTGLTGSIPARLFSNCPKVTSFAYTFNVCYGLTGVIPGILFANCPNVVSFSNTFGNSSNLTKISAGLFANCPNVTNFAYTFYMCKGLIGSIPEGLFANCPNVTDFHQTFYYCDSLTGSIPADLFANCLDLTMFSATFAYCKNLTESIPVTLFTNCPNITSFSQTFQSCESLSGIPIELFVNCPNATNFNQTFYNCHSLIGNAPVLWGKTGVTGANCFYNCTQLTNYSSIDADWK